MRALNCHCLLLKNTGRQDRYVIWIEATVVSLDCRKSSGDIIGETGTWKTTQITILTRSLTVAHFLVQLPVLGIVHLRKGTVALSWFWLE